MQTSTFKTSTIFVATGKRTRVFQSMDDVPRSLRKRMTDNLSGPNTRTLIVADRRGREYLLKALQRVTNGSGLLLRPDTHLATQHERLHKAWTTAKRYWLEIALIGLLGGAGWGLFYLR
jgi:hypothetical protein